MSPTVRALVRKPFSWLTSCSTWRTIGGYADGEFFHQRQAFTHDVLADNKALPDPIGCVADASVQ